MRLPPRCVSSLLGLRYAADLTRLDGTGQDRAHLDKRHPYRAMTQDGFRPHDWFRLPRDGQVPRRRPTRLAVARMHHPRYLVRARQGDAVEGDVEGRVGVRERYEQLDGCCMSMERSNDLTFLMDFAGESMQC